MPQRTTCSVCLFSSSSPPPSLACAVARAGRNGPQRAQRPPPQRFRRRGGGADATLSFPSPRPSSARVPPVLPALSSAAAAAADLARPQPGAPTAGKPKDHAEGKERRKGKERKGHTRGQQRTGQGEETTAMCIYAVCTGRRIAVRCLCVLAAGRDSE
jgi:hypothetical protein